MLLLTAAAASTLRFKPLKRLRMLQLSTAQIQHHTAIDWTASTSEAQKDKNEDPQQIINRSDPPAADQTSHHTPSRPDEPPPAEPDPAGRRWLCLVRRTETSCDVVVLQTHLLQVNVTLKLSSVCVPGVLIGIRSADLSLIIQLLQHLDT